MVARNVSRLIRPLSLTQPEIYKVSDLSSKHKNIKMNKTKEI